MSIEIGLIPWYVGFSEKNLFSATVAPDTFLGVGDGSPFHLFQEVSHGSGSFGSVSLAQGSARQVAFAQTERRV
jgi:hypothetical protein